mmetsp:Transcript_19264/g.31029  ORF Transcript_19264/g.31029 Transcript_19264/m.31029 type:complete len:121 (+) Transcript_19264:1252-1614(+)
MASAIGSPDGSKNEPDWFSFLRVEGVVGEGSGTGATVTLTGGGGGACVVGTGAAVLGRLDSGSEPDAVGKLGPAWGYAACSLEALFDSSSVLLVSLVVPDDAATTVVVPAAAFVTPPSRA